MIDPFSFGFPLPRAVLSALLALNLLAPLALILWLRRAALRAGPDDVANTWFGYMRNVSWIVTMTWIGWMCLVMSGGVVARLAMRMSPHGLPLTSLGLLGLVLVPPALVSLAATVFSHPVGTRLRGTENTLAETLNIALLQLASLLGPLACLVMVPGALFAGHTRLAIAALLGGVVLAIVLLQARAQASGISPEAVSSGELRDRLFALAHAAGVRLQQLYVLPMHRSRTANAFAVRGGTVMLTDHLLEHLSRREVDAVMAHEIAHLRRGDPLRLAMALILVPVVLMVVLPSLVGPLAMPIAVLLGAGISYFISRRFERSADAGAVRLTGDPEALISALARLNRLNHIPVEWGRWTERWLTHPSTRRRADAIAQQGQITPERVAELLRGEPSPDARYAPGPTGERAKAFSSAFKVREISGLSWILLLSYALTPALAIGLALRLGPGSGGRPALFVIAAVATAIVTLLAFDRIATRPYRPLRRAIADRLRTGGVDPDASHGLFVGLAPDAAPRLYENFSDWDVGFLFFSRDQLVYVGEETRFALSRAQIEEVRLVQGLPSWVRVSRVLVVWGDEARELRGTLTLRDADAPTLGSIQPSSEQLLARIESWRTGATVEASFAPPILAGPPTFGQVTSLSPKALGSARLLIANTVLTTLGAAGACALLGLSLSPAQPGFVETSLAAFAALILNRVPTWRHREVTRTPDVAPERRAA
jgi:Zn-dependent protease with chaperone function